MQNRELQNRELQGPPVVTLKKFREINVLVVTFTLIACRINYGSSET